jgi:hypothetical protein
LHAAAARGVGKHRAQVGAAALGGGAVERAVDIDQPRLGEGAVDPGEVDADEGEQRLHAARAWGVGKHRPDCFDAAIVGGAVERAVDLGEVVGGGGPVGAAGEGDQGLHAAAARGVGKQRPGIGAAAELGGVVERAVDIGEGVGAGEVGEGEQGGELIGARRRDGEGTERDRGDEAEIEPFHRPYPSVSVTMFALAARPVRRANVAGSNIKNQTFIKF